MGLRTSFDSNQALGKIGAVTAGPEVLEIAGNEVEQAVNLSSYVPEGLANNMGGNDFKLGA